MTLLENWRNKAYGDATDNKQKEEIWKNYFLVEKGIYEKILCNPKDVITCTVAELAAKFDTDIETITGFLDGINDSLNKPNPIEEMKEDTTISLDIDLEKLYYNKDTEHPNEAEVIIAKQRNGAIGTINLVWKPDITKFVNMAR